MTSYQSVLFDLDGTLLDTAPDLSAALNQVLCDYNKKPVAYLEMRSFVHGGSQTILGHAFDIETSNPEYATINQKFLDYYAKNLTARTQYFPNMEYLLDQLDHANIPWGIVTNKPEIFTLPLLKSFGLTERTRAIVSGDTLPKAKPNPEPLLHACEMAGLDPRTTIYVGDSYVDVQAAQSANITPVVAAYGYIPFGHDPKTWNADHIIYSPLDILKFVDIPSALKV